jgi:hypothetical protein
MKDWDRMSTSEKAFYIILFIVIAFVLMTGQG